MGQRTVGVKKGINKDLDYNKLIRGQYRLKLSRLPWSVTEEQIREFLFGSAVIGVSIEKGEHGRPNGDAIVYVNTFACVENAMKFQKQELGNRNIDIACYDDKPRPNPLNPSIQLKLMEEIKREKQSGGSTKSSSTSSQSGSKAELSTRFFRLDFLAQNITLLETNIDYQLYKDALVYNSALSNW